MNAHSRMWGCVNNCAKGSRLVDIITGTNMVVINDKKPTTIARVGSIASAIDLSIVSDGLAIDIEWEVTEENLGGDHLWIEMRVGGTLMPLASVKKILNQKIWIEKMNEILSANESMSVTQLNSSIESVNTECMRTVLGKAFTIKSWWNNEIRYWYDRKRIVLRLFNQCKCIDCQIELNRATGKLKKAIRKAKRKSWRAFVSEMTPMTSTKDVWKMFNKVRSKSTRCKNFVLSDRERGRDFLRMILNVQKYPNVDAPEIYEDIPAYWMNDKFEMEEFLRVLNNVKSTTPGTNLVSFGMIQKLSILAKTHLLNVLNSVWESNEIPQQWLECRLVPIPKRDRDPQLANNYRGISMLNVLLKLINGMLKDRVERFFNEKNCLPNTTFGFRRNRSAVDCVERLVWEIKRQDRVIVVVFLDVERAYDFVDPRIMQDIILSVGIPKKISEWIFKFMSERKLILNGRDYKLEELIDIGLPQGSKLSPTLFNLYTSGIHDMNEDNKMVLQFADDFAVIGKGRNLNEAKLNAQECLNNVVLKLSNLNLQVNARKCGCMSFRVNGRINVDISIGNEGIEQVNVFKYLGIWVDRLLRFTKHMDFLTDECKKRINLMKAVSKPKWGAHPSVADMLRKALISSKILFGISVYGNGAKGRIEKLVRVENAAIRVVLGAINSTPIQTLWSEVGDMPLSIKKEWVTLKETVRMKSLRNTGLCELMSRLPGAPPFKSTHRSELIQEHYELISKIGNQGRANKPDNLDVKLKFGSMSKSDMNESMVRKIFMEIKQLYMFNYCTYTDASVSDNGVGVGIFVPCNSVEVDFKLNENICIMNAELIAMYEAIKLGLKERMRKIVIFSDSMSGMIELNSGGGKMGNVYVDKIYKYVTKANCRVIIQWIPSHRGIIGNVKADELAKRGSVSGELKSYSTMDARDVLRELEYIVWEKWVNEYRYKCQVTGKKYFDWNNVPRKTPFYKEFKGGTRMLRTIERIRLNHGNWKECLYKRKLEVGNLCERCNVVEDIEHLLTVCPTYSQQRACFKCLLNGQSLTEILSMEGDAYKEIYEFVLETGINV